MVHIAGSPCTGGPTDDFVSASCRADLNDGGSSASDLEDLRGRFAAGERAKGPVPTETLFAALTVLAACLGIDEALGYVGHLLRERRGGLMP